MMSNPDSISRGLRGSYFYAPEEEKVYDVEAEKSNRILVYTTKDIKNHCYVLLKKDDQWLIDSKKRKYNSEDKWQTDYL